MSGRPTESDPELESAKGWSVIRLAEYQRIVDCGDRWDWGGLWDLFPFDGPKDVTTQVMVVALSPAGAWRIAAHENPGIEFGEAKLQFTLSLHGFLCYGPGTYEENMQIANVTQDDLRRAERKGRGFRL